MPSRSCNAVSLEEKMNFFDGVHTNRIPLLSECGDEIEWKRKAELEDMLSGSAKK